MFKSGFSLSWLLAAALCCEVAVAQSSSETEYKLWPARPVSGQPIRISGSGEFAANFEVVAPASLDGNVITATTSVQRKTSTFIGYSGTVGYFSSLPPGTYELRIEEISLDLDGEEQGRHTWSADIEVLPDSFFLSSGMTGSWYDPEQSGHGINLEFLPDERLIGYWYTFDADGNPAWLVFEGTHTATMAEVTVLEVAGGAFPPDFDPDLVERTAWGTLQFEFSDCRQGRMTWQTDRPGFSPGAMDLVKLSPPVGLPCRDPSNVSNADTFVPVARQALEEDHVLLYDYDAFSPADWVVEHEALPDEFNVPDFLGVDTALRITGTSGSVVLLTRVHNGIASAPGQYFMAEMILRIATRQLIGCEPGHTISFNIYSGMPETFGEAEDPSAAPPGVVGLTNRGNPSTSRVDLGSAVLERDETDECVEQPLTEMTLRSTSGELLTRAGTTVGIHVRGSGDTEFGVPVDFYLIEANLRLWEVVEPEAVSLTIPGTD